MTTTSTNRTNIDKTVAEFNKCSSKQNKFLWDNDNTLHMFHNDMNTKQVSIKKQQNLLNLTKSNDSILTLMPLYPLIFWSFQGA